MARDVRNVAASVRTRLKNLALANRASFERVLRRYALERLLFRSSVSRHKERFILKGAMLYAAWLEDPFRTTGDLDLLALGKRETERIVAIFREICAHAVEDDGLTFDAERIAAQPIRDDRANGGLRLRTAARLAAAVIPVQIDIGFGDVVTPSPVELEYPVLLDQPVPTLNAYPQGTVAAEKFKAIIVLDLANSRMKDFYNLLAMSLLFAFEGATLAATIRTTYARHLTAVPWEHSPSLTEAFSGDPRNVEQWRSFLVREPLMIDEPDLPTMVRDVGDFIMPTAHAAIGDLRMPGLWSTDGGWRPVP